MENNDKNKLKALERVKEEIEKINKKENTVYFFVIDTKGLPSGSLEYIYNLALMAKDGGYNVTMLYQDENFVGVRDWLGDKYADLPHESVTKETVNVSPADILFIPEIFATVMNQTKKLPCKRIAILQNYDYMAEQMPLSVQWGDFGIMECVTNTEYNADLLKEAFPYVKTKVIKPFISKIFGTTSEPKDMIINIVAKDPEDVNKIVKPFYWKYPAYKWVTFRDLRGMPKHEFANALRKAAITIWADDSTSFGYSAIEAMKSGSIVIAKVPDNVQGWMVNVNEDNDEVLTDGCLWFNSFHSLHKNIASVVRGWITDSVPDSIYENIKQIPSLYSESETKEEFLNYLNGIIENRLNDMKEILKKFS